MITCREKLGILIGDTIIKFGSYRERAKFLYALADACRYAAECSMKPHMEIKDEPTTQLKFIRLLGGMSRNVCSAFTSILASSIGVKKNSPVRKREQMFNNDCLDEWIEGYKAANGIKEKGDKND